MKPRVIQEASIRFSEKPKLLETRFSDAHPAERLAGTVEPKLFKWLLLLARQKTLKETGTPLSKSLRPGSEESLTNLGHTATLGRSDRFRLFLQV